VLASAVAGRLGSHRGGLSRTAAARVRAAAGRETAVLMLVATRTRMLTSAGTLLNGEATVKRHLLRVSQSSAPRTLLRPLLRTIKLEMPPAPGTGGCWGWPC
jgi:hypothetical protein